MTEFLVFTLYAPLASWGEITVGESRGSWDRPSRSAILGLLAAALGITRERQDDHDALNAGYGLGVRLDAAGTPLSDYHTAQTVAAALVKKHRPVTRAALLAAGERETILSRRAYRQDAAVTAALWSKRGARWTLPEMAAALQRPAFVLYAGRKANVFGWPLAPEVLVAETLSQALGRRSVPPYLQTGLRPRGGWGQEVAHDPCEEGVRSGLTVLRHETRRDAGAQRERWQFAERTVVIGLPTGAVELDADTGPGMTVEPRT